MWAFGITATVLCTSKATVHDFPEPVCPTMAECRPNRFVGSSQTLTVGCDATVPSARPLDWKRLDVLAPSLELMAWTSAPVVGYRAAPRLGWPSGRTEPTGVRRAAAVQSAAHAEETSQAASI